MQWPRSSDLNMPSVSAFPHRGHSLDYRGDNRFSAFLGQHYWTSAPGNRDGEGAQSRAVGYMPTGAVAQEVGPSALPPRPAAHTPQAPCTPQTWSVAALRGISLEPPPVAAPSVDNDGHPATALPLLGQPRYAAPRHATAVGARQRASARSLRSSFAVGGSSSQGHQAALSLSRLPPRSRALRVRAAPFPCPDSTGVQWGTLQGSAGPGAHNHLAAMPPTQGKHRTVFERGCRWSLRGCIRRRALGRVRPPAG